LLAAAGPPLARRARAPPRVLIPPRARCASQGRTACARAGERNALRETFVLSPIPPASPSCSLNETTRRGERAVSGGGIQESRCCALDR
jgi:hypothetical protein